MTTPIIRLSALAAAAMLCACGDSGGPSATGRQVAFHLATQPAVALPAAAALAGQEVLVAGNDTIVVTSVEMVLRRIELRRSAGQACDTTQVSDDCEEMRLGPVLLDLPLGSGTERAFTVAMDTGSYDAIEFEIHKPESGDDGDAAFLAQHPGFDGVSIRATGTLNGVAFTYTSDLDVEQEHEFVPPIVITDQAGASVTLRLDLQGWFLNQAGDGFLDPNTANKGGQNEGEVKSNIEASINAFEDENHDGEDDHGN